MDIPKGSIVGYIGQNGAGKSSTIKLMLSLLKKDSGKIQILDDNDLFNKVGVVFDNLNFNDEHTLKTINIFCSMLYKNWDKKYFYSLKDKFNLPENLTIKRSINIFEKKEF